MRKIRSYIKIVLKTGIEACFDYKKHIVRASEGLVSVYKESTEEKVFVTPMENVLYIDLSYFDFAECPEVKENDEAVR